MNVGLKSPVRTSTPVLRADLPTYTLAPGARLLLDESIKAVGLAPLPSLNAAPPNGRVTLPLPSDREDSTHNCPATTSVPPV